MANKGNPSKNNPSNIPAEGFRHIRTNPITGQNDYFYPLEISDPSILALARERRLEVSRTRLGNRIITAAMIPCKNTATINGKEVFVDTPSDVQRQRYLDLIRDELAAQDAARQDGRCQISNGRGGVKRCPCRMPNPAYTPGGEESKTLPVKCSGCAYEEFRQAHTTIVLSALDHEGDDGEMQTYEIPAQKDINAADRYLELRDEFIDFVRQHNPKLVPLAERLTMGFSKSEAARELGDAWSTVTSRADKLKALTLEFLDSIVSL